MIDLDVPEKFGSSADGATELWHYTTLEGAAGILSSFDMWATDSRFLNDPEEFQHALSVAREVVKQDLLEDEFRQEVIGWLSRLEAYDSENAPPLFMSFSEAPDDLVQWRSYSSEGTGVALVFDRESLERGVEACGGNLHRCTYVPVVPGLQVPNKVREEIRAFLSELRTGWAGYRSSDPEDVTDRNCLLRDAFRSGGDFDRLKLTLKPIGFENEREWRAVFRARNEGIELRVVHGRLVPFRRIPILKNAKILKRIVVGPAISDGLTKTALQEYTWSRPIDASIVGSAHRFRR